jgi:hypothetical protein
VLGEHGWQIAPSGYWAAKARPSSARDLRDEQIVKIMYEIRGRYGRGAALVDQHICGNQRIPSVIAKRLSGRLPPGG